MATFTKQMQQMPQQTPLLAFGMAEERAARSVFVGNIPYEATEEQLKEIFNQAGPVVSFRLVYDRETGKPKGYGFCEYQDLETAQCAMRNLNNHDFNGRPLRVGVAAGEQGKDEGGRLMQQALGGPAIESPFGEPVETEKAPEAISRAVASLPPEQMFELMKQMKLCIQNNPNEARNMLLQNPQLAYALLQAQIVMKIVDPQVALAMLHRPTEQIPPLLPSSAGSSAAGGFLSASQPLVNQSQQNLEARPGFVPSAAVGRGGPLLGPGPSLGPGGLPVMGPGGMMGGVGQGPPGNLGPGSEFGLRGPMPGPRGRGGLLGDMPPGERRDGPVGPRGPGGFIGDPRGPVRAEMGGRDPGHLMMNMGGNLGPRPDIGMGLGPRADMGPGGLRPDGGMGPRREPGPGMGHGPRMEMGAGQRPRMDMGPGPRMEMGPRDTDARPPRGMPVLLGDVREPRPDSDMRTARIQPMNVPGAAPVRPAGPSPGPSTPGPQISPQDQEKAALIMQVLQLSDEQIAMLPSDQRQSILILKEQIARSASK